MKRWLQENIPARYLRYTTVMRYKAAAQKLRRIAGLDDPVPAAAVEPPSEDTTAEPPSDTTRNGQNADVAGDGGVRLRCGRNRSTDMLDIQDGTGGVDACGGTGMTDVLDGSNGLDVCGGTGGVENHDGANMTFQNRGGMGAYAAAIVRARAVWRDVVADVAGHGPTALVARIDAYALQGRSV